MSAIGPKRTSGTALHMSAFGGKADMGCLGGLSAKWLSRTDRDCVSEMSQL